jgi:hypothetical protein
MWSHIHYLVRGFIHSLSFILVLRICHLLFFGFTHLTSFIGSNVSSISHLFIYLFLFRITTCHYLFLRTCYPCLGWRTRDPLFSFMHHIFFIRARAPPICCWLCTPSVFAWGLLPTLLFGRLRIHHLYSGLYTHYFYLGLCMRYPLFWGLRSLLFR